MWDRKEFEVFWSKRSALEKRLLIFVTVLFLILFFILLILVFSKTDKTCVSSDCVSAATHILDYVDPTTRPCDDFHQFVCGSYLKKAIEYNKPSATKYMEEITRNQIESIIAGDPELAVTYSLKLQRLFYRSCMNTTALEAEENDTFLTLLDALGGWPAIKSNFWDEQAFDWKLTMIKARKLGLSFQKFIGLEVVYIEENVTALQIIPPDDVDHISYEIMEPYVEVMRDIAGLLQSPSLGVSSELRHVVHFQNELHKIIQRAHNVSSVQRAKNMEIRQWQEIFPRTSWLQFLNNLLSGAAVLKDSDVLSIRSEQYLSDLEKLLLKTDKRVQANYFVWKIVEKFIPFLTENIRNRYHKFQRQLPEKRSEKKTRREVCIDLSKEVFTDVAEIEYVRKYATPNIRSEVKKIFGRVKDELLRRLKTTTRLTAEFKKEMEEEMRNTTINVGGSEFLFDVEKTEQTLGYNDLAFFDNDLVKMVTKVSINRINHMFSDIGGGDFSEIDFINRPHTSVNAYYVDSMDLLILPVPLLQDIFYNENRPNYMNYGALVTTIGHEFAHSIGKLGNQSYFEKGKYTFVYNHAFFDAFGNSSRCFENQYKHFYNNTAKNPEIPVNSNDTLEENIADFVGTDIGYQLYQEYVEDHGTEAKLPGLDYTPNQMFWIMTGTFLCRRPGYGKEGLYHAAGVYRINYRLRNLPQFARDFYCPEGSFMNPEDKCRIF